MKFANANDLLGFRTRDSKQKEMKKKRCDKKCGTFVKRRATNRIIFYSRKWNQNDTKSSRRMTEYKLFWLEMDKNHVCASNIVHNRLCINTHTHNRNRTEPKASFNHFKSASLDQWNDTNLIQSDVLLVITSTILIWRFNRVLFHLFCRFRAVVRSLFFSSSSVGTCKCHRLAHSSEIYAIFIQL